MSQAGAKANRRRKVEQEFVQHAREVAGVVAEQFQPIYQRALERARVAEERAAILQTVVERIALEGADFDPGVEARLVLDQLGIVPDVQTEEPDDG